MSMSIMYLNMKVHTCVGTNVYIYVDASKCYTDFFCCYGSEADVDRVKSKDCTDRLVT
ncbi:hypothetical protein HanXRQr2_Chr14g0634881 [Helianthus annuus]|uniref:Uncharacterized protein n=1 Tax=Helianthus annuus TaxID=4232 RepID=A0A9K3E7K1_HELAN|nr:hypothetical protein HanXRQr2_Chr14g0634881 [Helianthus annuus]